MKTTNPHNSICQSRITGARRLAGLAGGVLGGLSPDLSPTFGFVGYLFADAPTGGALNRDTALAVDSKSSPFANEHRPGSTGWQARLTPGRRMPITG